MVFWKDEGNGIWTGKTSAFEEVDYFGNAQNQS